MNTGFHKVSYFDKTHYNSMLFWKNWYVSGTEK